LFDVIASLLAVVVLSPILLLAMLCAFISSPLHFCSRRFIQGPPFHSSSSAPAAGPRSAGLSPDSRAAHLLGRWMPPQLDERQAQTSCARDGVVVSPLLMEYLPLYSARQRRRHDVHPGLTGWAQINGRNAIDWQQRFELDVWYVDHWSFWLDLQIILSTIWKVIAGQGISQPGRATTDTFRGNGD
jgi:sugar transferase EpsL